MKSVSGIIVAFIFASSLAAQSAKERDGADNPTIEVLLERIEKLESRVAALVAVYLACFHDHSSVLARGERGTVLLLACDRAQSRTVFRYVAGLFAEVPMLRKMLDRKTAEGIHLTARSIL